MSEQPSLPTEDDLKQLPLRAIVAYAMRCARRVQPLLLRATGLPGHERNVGAVDEATLAAERFCRGEQVTAADADAHAAYADAVNARAACAAADAAARAAYASYAAARATRAAAARAAAENAAAYAVNAADAATDATADAAADADAEATAVRAAEAAAKADYDRLLSLNLGVYPELGQPIDPTENGPLGSLWPE